MSTFYNNLIYDVGAHKGEDTLYYLLRGYKVVAIEADPDLAKLLRDNYADWIAKGLLTVVEAAVCEEESDEITFYKNINYSVWGTTVPDFVERNDKSGTKTIEIKVPTTNMRQLFSTFGIPYYLKIDIEGMDLIALKQLLGETIKPTYVSIESEKINFSKLVDEFSVFDKLGYNKFQLVQQASVAFQKIPKQTSEGNPIEFQFERGSSGLFGSDLGEDWITKSTALEKYKKIFKMYSLLGDSSLVRKFKPSALTLRALQRVLGIGLPGWYDTHAKLGNTK